MKRSRLWKTPFSAFLVTLLSVLILPGTSRAAMSDYCQIPTYAYQSVIPSVSFLISNSKSMLNFAYGDPASPQNLCTDNNAACGGFSNGSTYYGYFDNNSWYQYSSSAGGGFEIVGSKTTTPSKGGNAWWDGNFLNWLALRRIDVVRKVITGGEGLGYATCLLNNALYKKFPMSSVNFTPYSADNVLVTFNQQNNCAGLSPSTFSIVTGVDNKGNPVVASFKVQEMSTAPSGIYQTYAGKAQMEFFFYNGLDDEGASTKRGINGTQPPLSTMLNLINTPSNYNGIANAPLGEALWTIVGHYALSTSSSGAGYGGCPVGSVCGPKYHNNDYSIQDDPYTFYGNASQCVKGNVIVISDGEPCADGNLPSDISAFTNGATSTQFLTKCDGTTCDNATSLGIEYKSGQPSCDGVKSGFERVALFAHTQDLRQLNTFDGKDLGGKQNLDIYVIRAFGSDNSNILKYGAINGSFIDSDGNGVPSSGEFDISGGPNSAYFQPDNGAAIKKALEGILFNILKRATSGTAASVLASGEGSGANLVQAVFYPKRNFSGEVIEWTGTLQNLWYYIDPFFGNSSIREDSDQNGILNLVSDNTITFRYDPVAQLTKADLYKSDPLTGNPPPNATPIASVAFEEVKSLWEAGKLLYLRDPGLRNIFTNYGTGYPAVITDFKTTTTNKSKFQSFLGEAAGWPSDNVDALINYVRGVDNTNLRNRTVKYPSTATSDNVWRLGDIINSTPRVVASIPLNNYNTTYNDSSYKAFTDNSTNNSSYKNRGMVFAGANDGMLHAFKLGKLVFPADSNWGTPSPTTWDRARLINLDTSVPLGQEQWAFIPKNALPYLQALQDNNYCHLNYVDLAPQVFDASIGGDNTAGNISSKDWRTVLIGGMRFGGACRYSSGACNTTDNNCVKSPVSDGGLSSYFAMDVTDPESPTVLWEFTDPELGFATTGPAIVRINANYKTTNGNWYAVFGSGPTGPISSRQFLGHSDQNLRLFIVDLKTGDLLRTIDTGIQNAFAGSMINSTADFDLDYTDDVLYVGYVKANGGTWNQGGVGRLQTNGSVNPYDWKWNGVIDNIGPVTSSVVRLQNNITQTNWLFFGTGRYYYFLPSDPNAPNTPGYDDPTAQRRLYGIKEPCFVNGTITPNCITSVGTASLTDRSTASSTAITNSGWFINLDTNTTSISYDNTGAQSYLAERVITDPLATTAGVVLFTTLRPYNGSCAVGGRTFLWAVQYDTGGVPPFALQGKAMMQVSTASVEQLDLGTAFSKSVPGADASLHRGGRRSYSMEGVPPTAQGLSLLVPPPPVKRILHMKER
jgi:type IV pilus assembly protein PilY1